MDFFLSFSVSLSSTKSIASFEHKIVTNFKFLTPVENEQKCLSNYVFLECTDSIGDRCEESCSIWYENNIGIECNLVSDSNNQIAGVNPFSVCCVQDEVEPICS